MKLLVNADDYGMTAGVSRGIIEGMQTGIVTSTSAIVNAPAFPACASYALEHGLDRMGVHAMLTMVRPLLPADEVPSLVDKQGRFRDRAGFFAAPASIEEARAELECQIETFLATGLSLTHIDTHHGFMMRDEAFFTMFLELAEHYGVPLRNEPSRRDTPLARRCRDLLAERSVPAVDMVYFNHGTPHHTVGDVEQFLADAESRYCVVELGCHPGYSDDELRLISVLNDDREAELAVVTDPGLRAFIAEHDIELVGYDGIN